MKNFFSFFYRLLITSIRASISVRGAFLLESAMMIFNNLIFVFIWWIFFRQFRDVGGWTLRDLIALNAIGMGAYGVMMVCFGGVKQLARVIINGDLDPFMTQPKNLLVHLLSSKSQSKGWGNIMTAAVLITFGGLWTFPELPLIMLGIVCGSIVFTAASVMAHSCIFWLGPIESVSKRYCDSLFLFALYPSNIYSGLLQVVMFTLIPAGIIGYLPVELVRSFNWEQLAALILGTVSFAASAFFIFYRGLKRYESGNQFGMRL